jgi:bleomycin hydrolase
MITNKKIDEWDNKFNKNKINIICKNAVNAMGSMIATTDSSHLNNVNHIFMNSLKHQGIHATNQGSTGRCWLFAGMNIFRHQIAAAFKLNNFEFSSTYLFFFDKLERANNYLEFFLNNDIQLVKDQKLFDFYVDSYSEDGGWWNMFANLVNKYGLIPKNAMKETFQSEYSDDMNRVLRDIIQPSANFIFQNRKRKNMRKELRKCKKKTMEQVYNTLVKYLGEPPVDFRWSFMSEKINGVIIDQMTPALFTTLTIGTINIQKDFCVFANVPTLKYDKMYNVLHTNNVYGTGDDYKFHNVRMIDVMKYCLKSLLSGVPVWIAADVSKSFNPYYSVLCDRLDNSKLVFGETKTFSKKEQMIFGNIQANHAMTIVGVNLNRKNEPIEWQVENSWGYWNNEVPGEDGFLTMSHSWFMKNVIQVVIKKDFLSRTLLRKVEETPININPWDTVAPALKIKPRNAPKNYIKHYLGKQSTISINKL